MTNHQKIAAFEGALLDAIHALGASSSETRQMFEYAGMPSEWRSGLVSSISAFDVVASEIEPDSARGRLLWDSREAVFAAFNAMRRSDNESFYEILVDGCSKIRADIRGLSSRSRLRADNDS